MVLARGFRSNCIVILFILLLPVISAYAIDSDLTCRTLAGIKGFSVAVEEMQPNIQKYASRFGLTKDRLQKEIEQWLSTAGIVVLQNEQWVQVPGRPVLYVNINTYLYQKYWYSYTVKVEVRQIANLEAMPDMKTLAATWSTEMTGTANIGTLNVIKNNVKTLINRFISVYQSANKKENVTK